MDRAGREFLHAPGPTHIPDRVLNAMHRQPLDLSDPRLEEICYSAMEDMKAVFRTSGRVFVYACNGHGGWEAALANLCAPGDAVLVPGNGRFSESWGHLAELLELAPEIMPGDWRHAIDADAVEDRLRRDTGHRIKAVLVVHTDTATGITSDVAAVRRAMDAAGHPAFLVVDTIASLATTPFEMDAWGVNVAIAASQKALMCPPGLALLAVDERALEHARTVARGRSYWDWHARLDSGFYRKFAGTAPEHHLFALREALDIIAEQGLEAIFHRHARLARAVQGAVAAWSAEGAMSFNAVVPEQRSNAVTTILTTEGPRLRTHAREALGVSLAGGLGRLEGKAFRIGHMGDVNEPMILGCLATVELAMSELGIPHGSGLRAAVDALATQRAGDRAGEANGGAYGREERLSQA